MADPNGSQYRGKPFKNDCSSQPTGFNSDCHSLVEQYKQAYVQLVRRQVDNLEQRSGGTSVYQPNSRHDTYQQQHPGGSKRGYHRPGFCPEDNGPSNAQDAFDPFTFSGYDTHYNADDRPNTWNIRPDGPCPKQTENPGQRFPNPCSDRPEESSSRNLTQNITAFFKGNKSQCPPNESKSTVNLGTLPWNPQAKPSDRRVNPCEDRPGASNRGNTLQQELLKAQSCCTRPHNRQPGFSPSATEICRSHMRSPNASRTNIRSSLGSHNGARSLVRLLMLLLVVICAILLLAYVAYLLCTFSGFCGGGCKLEKTIHYVPY